jgi:hypothetical protein
MASMNNTISDDELVAMLRDEQIYPGPNHLQLAADRIEALRADAERLDWIERECRTEAGKSTDGDVYVWCVYTHSGQSLRAAINAAQAREQT